MLAYLWGKLKIWDTTKSLRKHASTRRQLPLVELLEDRCVPTVTIGEFPVLTAGSAPYGITAGPDGNLWFTESQANQIGTINPTTHALSEFPILTDGSGPLGITAGPDGNLWFAEYTANQIGMINPTTHTVTEFAIPTSNSNPEGVAAGPDGNIWFTESTGNNIGMINPTTHAISEFAIPTASSNPLGIAAGPDGNLWFTESNANQIGTINPITHMITEFAIPQANSQPYEIAGGPNGSIWFTESSGAGIGAVNTATHVFSLYPLPTAKSGPLGIAAGPDGNVWFTENVANQIGMLNPATGVVTETIVPSAASAPTKISAGAGGALWFTESSGNRIGQVVANPTITINPVSQTITAGHTVTFTAGAEGLPPPAVQWQVSTDGGATFAPLANSGGYSGVTTKTLTITDASSAMSGYQYQAVFTNGVAPAPSATTSAAVLTVTSPLSITPAPPQGIAGASYNHTLSVMGSATPFTVLLANNFHSGTTGLTLSDITTNTLNGTIVISGTPTAPGTASFTVHVANTGGDKLTQNLVITIRAPLSIDTASLPNATAGINYNQAIAVAGGVLPYTTFKVTKFNGGTTGLTMGNLSAQPGTGVFNVNGKPSAAGIATFTINVTESTGTSVTRDFSITVNPPLVFTPSLPAGTAGTNYNQTLTVTGGGTPYTSLAVSQFNGSTTGLTAASININSAAGTVTLNGTPSAAGTVTFTVNVVDATGGAVHRVYSVKINPSLAITPTLPQGSAGANYHRMITVTGGTKPYTTFKVTGFHSGTTGLGATAIHLNSAAGLIGINGRPTGAGTVSFTVNVTDTAGNHLTQKFKITINPAPTLGTLSTTQWTAGKSGFTAVIALTGGTGPFTLAGSSGLPAGLTAVLIGNEIHFTGIPSTAQTFPAGSVTIRDAAGAIVTSTFSVTINPAPAIGSPSRTRWTVNSPGFFSTMTATGGTGGLGLTGSTGLPPGLTAVLTGNTIRFTGTPAVAGTFAGSVTLRDAVGAGMTRPFSFTITAQPTLGSLTATQWTEGKSGFTGVLPISGGTGRFTITSSSGLPTGLTAVLNGHEVHFIGTPSEAGTFAAGKVTIRDTAGATATKTFGITINPPLKFTTTSLPTSRMGALYSAVIHTEGGTGAITFALTSGSLPPGIKLSQTGIISGVSRGIGSFTATITATDAVGATSSEKITLLLTLR